MFLFDTFANGFAHLLHPAGSDRAWHLPNVRALWLMMLFVGALFVIGLIGYGVLTFRSLDQLDIAMEEPDISRRLARVLDEELLRSVHAGFKAREMVHKELLENQPADIVDPAR